MIADLGELEARVDPMLDRHGGVITLVRAAWSTSLDLTRPRSR
ncbi:MAG: hypothetical protein R2705_21790 [Ilumatobacteraceae bacterium]